MVTKLLPRRAPSFFLASPALIVGAQAAFVGGLLLTRQWRLLGLLALLPAAFTLFGNAVVIDASIRVRRPFVMVGRNIALTSISKVQLVDGRDSWGGHWGSCGVVLVLLDGSVVPVPESASYSERRSLDWVRAIEELLTK